MYRILIYVFLVLTLTGCSFLKKQSDDTPSVEIDGNILHVSFSKNIPQGFSIRSPNNPQTLSVTKFGGQPDWIDVPQWPLSKELGEPMRFIGQVSLQEIGVQEHGGKVAYIFMTEDDDEYVDGTWEHDGGENAIIIQPNGTTQQPTQAIESGPTRDEFSTFLTNKVVEPDSIEGCRVGGEPAFMQGEEFPEPKSNWNFFAQLDSCSMPFEVNFGDAGIGYAFIDDDGTQGKFLWQCG